MFGIKELLIILLIAAVIFGTKRLRNMGGDLGSALNEFRKSMGHHDDDEHDSDKAHKASADDPRVINQDADHIDQHEHKTASHDHTS